MPAGRKAQNSATFIDGIGIPASGKNKKAAWLYVQWVTGKTMLTEVLRTGSGTPPRLSVYAQPEVVKASAFPQEWFDTTAGQPEDRPVGPAGDRAGDRVPRHPRHRRSPTSSAAPIRRPS